MSEVKTGQKRAPEKTGEKKAPAEKTVGAKVTLIFRENRRRELPVGREVFVFEGRKPVDVPAWVLEHKDFLAAAGEFVVKGRKG
jgi:hypothetical protein